MSHYKVFVDWNGDGDFSQTNEDVSADLSADALPVSYGRDTARAFAPVKAGECQFELVNLHGNYSPEDPASPLSWMVDHPGVWLQHEVAGTYYTIFRGFIDEFEMFSDPGNEKVSFSCFDDLQKFQGTPLSTELYTGKRTGEIIDIILDAIGWPTDMRTVDPGGSVLPFWWSETNVFESLMELLKAEGPPAAVYIEYSTGHFVFHDRHHRLTAAESMTSQITVRDAGADPRFSHPLGYDHGRRNIVNSVTFTVDERAPSAEFVDLWTSDETMTFAANETVTLFAQASDPFLNAQTPVAGVLVEDEIIGDYFVRSGSLTSVSLSRTFGQSVALTITAGAGGAVVEGMKIRGTPLPVARTVQVKREDSTSIAQGGIKSYPNDAPFVNRHDAAAVADCVIAHWSARRPTLDILIKNYNEAVEIQQLTRTVSDRITVIDTVTGINGEYYIEQVQKIIRGAGNRIIETHWHCEAAPQYPSNLFTFDVAGKGFNDGVFAGVNIDDANTVFRFDVAGHGFNDGVFAT